MGTRESSQAEPKYKDIINFKPVLIKRIQDPEVARALKYAPNYYLITKILRKGPMTVKELEKAYNKEAATSESYEPKSDKTIYRYLKTLGNADLVVPAGQRVVFGKTATETLFSRTARVFFIQEEEGPDWWISEKGRRLAKRIATLLGQFYKNGEPSIDCLQKLIIHFEKSQESELNKILTKMDESTLELVIGGEWEETDKILHYVKYFGMFLDQPDLPKRLRDCFK